MFFNTSKGNYDFLKIKKQKTVFYLTTIFMFFKSSS